MNNDQQNQQGLNSTTPNNLNNNLGINPMDQVIMPDSQPQNNNEMNNSGAPVPGVENLNTNPGVEQPVVNNIPNPAGTGAPTPTPLPTGDTYAATPVNNQVGNMGVNPMNPGPQPAPMNMGNVNPVPGVNPPINGIEQPAFDNPNSIGITPPPVVNNNQTGNGKKKGMNKTLFVVLILILLLAVGGGVYWYLNLPKKAAVTINTKDMTFDINGEIPTSIEDYATIEGTNASNCTIDVSGIDVTTPGEYKYVIKCGEVTKEGKALVADTTSPIVSAITLYKSVNDQNGIKAEEFIGTCYDNTKCIYNFEDESVVSSLLASEGSKTVNLIVTDESGNETKVEGKLNVVSDGVRAYYECTSSPQNLQDLNATMTISHTLGILKTNAVDNSLAFGNFGTQTYEYKFTDQEQFDTLLKEFETNKKVTINNVESIPTFDTEKMTITVVKDLDLASLKTQYGEDKYVSFKTIQDFYKNNLGYSCKTK